MGKRRIRNMSDAILYKKNLRMYKVIPGPGTYVLQTANTTKPEYLIEDGSASRYIVNLRAATMEGFEMCLERMGSKEYAPFKNLRECFSSGALWDKDIDDITRLPIKGEEVIATFEEKDGKLQCTALTLIPRKELPNFDLDALDKSRNLFKNLLKG